jgi:hypothetical protein
LAPENPVKEKKTKKRKEREYEEDYNYDLMKKSISENILSLNPEKRAKLEHMVTQGIDNAFQTFSNTQFDSISEELGSRNIIDSSWMIGLSKQEIKSYRDFIKKFNKTYIVHIREILEAKVVESEKLTALKLYIVLQNMETDSLEYFIMVDKIRKLIQPEVILLA